jgi:hypothetical protein
MLMLNRLRLKLLMLKRQSRSFAPRKGRPWRKAPALRVDRRVKLKLCDQYIDVERASKLYFCVAYQPIVLSRRSIGPNQFFTSLTTAMHHSTNPSFVSRPLLLMLGLLILNPLPYELLARPQQSNTIPDVEQFALAKDRKAFLDRLVPGSEEDYYFRCLHAQNTGDLEWVAQALPRWRDAWGETARWTSIRNRQAILNYQFQPDASARLFQDILGLHFGHQRQIPPAEQKLPTSLDQNLIARDILVRRAIDSNQLDWLTTESLYDQSTFFVNSQNQDQLRFLLNKLSSPDFPDLVKIVVAELKSSHSGGFGSIPVHNLLTLDQLLACREQHPDLAGNANWVHQVVQRMHGRTVALPELYKTRIEEFKQIWEFLRPLPISQNSLKSAVLHEILSLQLKSGSMDRDLFVEYLKLPHQLGWVPQLLRHQRAARPEGLVDSFAVFEGVLRGCLPPQPESLVETGLQLFLRDPQTIALFQPLVEEQFLNRQLAISQVLAGLGDNQRWSAILSPASYRELVERIDLAFQTEDRTWYAPEEAVSLNLKVKNIKELVVRIYELNSLNCYRTLGATVDADVSLDGLVPNHERTVSRSQAPAIQTIETIELPELKGRGLFVVDIIGGGKNCRALITKGRLVHVARTTRYGQEITVLDEQGQTCSPSAIWIGSRKFESDQAGKILVPFSNDSPGANCVLQANGFAYPAALSVQPEVWTLELAAHCDRESLLPGATAKFLLRPMLKVAGEPVPSDGMLENVSVQLTAVNLDNEPAVRNYPDVKLSQLGELSLEFMVPPRLKTLNISLAGDIRVNSQNSTVRLSAETQLGVNGIAETDKIVCPQILRNGDQYFVHVLGRNGEALTKYPISIELNTRWSSETVRVEMQSDEKGEISLGELVGVVGLKVHADSQNVQQWDLNRQSYQSMMSTISVPSETVVRLPIPQSLIRSDIKQAVRVFEKKHGQYLRELPNAAELKWGVVELSALAEGEYEVAVQGQSFAFTVWSVKGRALDEHLVNPLGATEMAKGSLLQIQELKCEQDKLQIKVEGASEFTRVHVFSTRYLPRFSAGLNLDKFSRRLPARTSFGWNGNRYVSARQLGDEYQYILNRKSLARIAGTMLSRPSLLMTPWSLGPTDTQQEQLTEDEAMSKGEGAAAPPMANAPGSAGGTGGPDIADFASLDFLALGTIILEDLEVGKDGLISIPLKDFGDKHHVSVVAVDLFSTSMRTIALEPKPLQVRDQRIDHALAKDEHFAMLKRASILKTGETFVLENLLTGKFETVTDLRGVWRFLLANSTDSGLAQFEFLTRWSELKDEERRKFYDQYACHELNFWLYKKDTKFFTEVVLPVLQNRHEPTFMDCWLLEKDLTEWSRPWRLAQLNTFEQILLAQRLPDARPGILRSLKEQFELQPPDDTIRDALFNSQLSAGQLEVEKSRSQLRVLTEMDAAGAADQVNSQPEAGGGGMGGMGMPAVRARKGGRDRLAEELRREEAEKADKSKNWVEEQPVGELKDSAKLAYREKKADKELESAQRSYFLGRRGTGAERGIAFYRELKPTERWVESAWFHISQTTATHDRIPLNRFWLAFAQQEQGKPFVNESFSLCRANLTDSILALAVIDLPEQSKEGKTEVDGKSVKWTSTGPAIVFHQQVANQALNAGQIMVSENFFDPSDRYQVVNNRQADKFITSPFYRGKLYGGQVVVTNPTSTPQAIQLLVQVPAGSIAVNRSHPTRALHVELGGFASSSVEYWFYFPAAGKLDHFPAHASDTTGILAHATPTTLTVLGDRHAADKNTWEHVSQNGSVEEVLDWLDKANLRKTDLELIAFRMKDKQAYQRILDLLSRNQIYHRTLWSYSVNHRDGARLGEFLEHETSFVDTCRPALESELLTLRPETRRWYEHVEFWPLVNARVHQVGSQRRILNNQLFQQYVELLNILSCHRELSSDDRLALVCYLLAQDRFAEALEWFDSVDRGKVAGKLQYDYAAAFLAMLQADPEKAEPIAQKWAAASPNRWRDRFAGIAAQCLELKGGKTELVDTDDSAKAQEQMAASVPSMEAKLEGGKLQISCRNTRQLSILYYPIDVELMFSRDPFGDQSEAKQPLVNPTFSETVEVPEQQDQLTHAIPERLGKQNLLIEVRNGEQSTTLRRLANRLDLQFANSMGHLQVRKAGEKKPMVATYVKVYAKRADGQVVFWKDGYTDLRGKFDYVSQSVQGLQGITQFAILLLDDKEGCVTKVVEPPQR